MYMEKKYKIIIRINIILLAVCAFLILGLFSIRKISSVKKDTRRALIERQLMECSELVTIKYNYSDVITIKKSSLFAKSYSLVKYSGVIRAGIPDPQYAEFRFQGKTIEVILPEAKVLGNEIVSQEVFDEQQSIFVPIRTQEVFDEIEVSRSLMEEAAVNEGLLKEARAHAESLLRTVLHSAGFESVIFY